jgi:hypothetical protein
MIEVSSAARGVLAYSRTAGIRVSSWLDGVLLADDVPVAEDQPASEEADASSNAPERITFTVPRRHRGVLWDPVGDDHPLAANGQRVSVRLGIGLGGTSVEWLQRGTFLIEDADPVDDVVTVTAVNLLTLVLEARLISPYQPTGTMASALRSLVEPALTVQVDPALTDRAVPAGVTYDDDRIGAVHELVDAWAAAARVDPFGVLQLRPSALGDPVLDLVDGVGGTVITARARSTRAGAANIIVARGVAADGSQVEGIAYDTSAGPKRYGGPFNPLPVPDFFFSPLLTTVNECSAAAVTILERRRRATGREFRVEMVPDPTLQLDDVVTLTTDTVTALPCSIERIDSLPYVASGGPGILTVRAI